MDPTEVQPGVWDEHTPVHVEGDNEQSYLMCPVATISACFVDFVVGTDWVRLGTFANGQRPVSDIDGDAVLEFAGHGASALT